MKVSLRRKIHIIALPQGTLNASWAPDQSATMPCHPPGNAALEATGGVCVCCAIWVVLVTYLHITRHAVRKMRDAAQTGQKLAQIICIVVTGIRNSSANKTSQST